MKIQVMIWIVTLHSSVVHIGTYCHSPENHDMDVHFLLQRLITMVWWWWYPFLTLALDGACLTHRKNKNETYLCILCGC